MSTLNINGFMLDEDIDVLSTFYTVAPYMLVTGGEEPQQTTYTTQFYTTYQYYIGTSYAAVLNFGGATEVGVYLWVALAILVVVAEVVVLTALWVGMA